MRHASEYDLRILAWNVRVTRSWREIKPHLEAFLHAHKPDVVVLIECYHVADDIAHDLGSQWRVHYDTKSGAPEAHDVVILVRRSPNVVLYQRGILAHNDTWVGPNFRRPKRGRVFPWVDVAKNGRAYRILGVHRISGRRIKENRPVWAAETKLLRTFAKNSTINRRIYAEIGDRNQSILTGGLKYARSIGGRYWRGHGPDAAVTIHATAKVRNLGAGGSDHDALLWTLTKESRK